MPPSQRHRLISSPLQNLGDTVIVHDVDLGTEQGAQFLHQRRHGPDARLISKVDEQVDVGPLGVDPPGDGADHPRVEAASTFDRSSDILAVAVEHD